MFDLSKINFINDENRISHYSFVGLQKDNDSINFYLPIGFNDFKQDSFENTKDLFLNLYKIFKKYQKNHIKNRDGNINQKGGFKFQSEENETILLYSKINMFDSILDEFDDMDIYSFHIKRQKSDKIDYSKIDEYIDQAIFMDNDTIYLDEVEINQDSLLFDESELVEMFCYIYCDIKKALLDDRDIPVEIQSLALNFREKHLTYDSSLFAENSFEITKDILKDRLEVIDKNALLKDATYDKIYEAIYIFLYGNPFFDGDEDIYWGIDNFAFVWEEMCHYYFFDKFKEDILFADTRSFENEEIGLNYCYKKDGFEYPFVLNYEEEKKYLYPDLVINIKEEKKLEFDNFFFTTSKTYTIPSGYNTFTNEYIEIKKRYKDNNILNDVFKVENILSINNDNYNLVKEGYILKQNRDYNGEYQSYIKRLKSSIIRYLNFRKKTLKIDNEIELFYDTINMIMDFKYMTKKTIKSNNNDKVNTDIKKQLLYKLALQSRDKELIIDNIFYIPSYLNKTDDIGIKSLNNSNIEVRYLNFNDAIKSYLEYSNE